MAHPAVFVKEFDTGPPIDTRLVDGDGASVNLTGATVAFSMNKGTNPIQTQAATIVDALSGRVRYDWNPVDLISPGKYDAEFQVTYSDGTVETFPRNGYIEVFVDPSMHNLPNSGISSGKATILLDIFTNTINTIIDTNATFVTDGVAIGDIFNAQGKQVTIPSSATIAETSIIIPFGGLAAASNELYVITSAT